MAPIRTVALSILLLLVATNSAMGAAPMTDEQAAAAYQEGRALYEAGRFAEAAERFAVAYAHFKDANILWNVGRSLEQAGDYEAARDRYTELLARDDVSAELRVDAGEALGRVGARIAARRSATTPALRRALLEQELAEARRANNAELAAKLEAELARLPPSGDAGAGDAGAGDAGAGDAGHDGGGTSTDTTAAGAAGDGGAGPDADPGHVPDPGPAPSGGSSIVGWIVGGAGVALLAGGAASYLVGQSKYDEIDASVTRTKNGVVQGLTHAEATALREDGATFKTLGVVGMSLGTIAVGTGAVLLLLADDEPAARTSVYVAPHPLPGGFGVGLSATY